MDEQTSLLALANLARNAGIAHIHQRHGPTIAFFAGKRDECSLCWGVGEHSSTQSSSADEQLEDQPTPRLARSQRRPTTLSVLPDGER